MAEEHQIPDWQQLTDFRAGKEEAYDYFFRKYFQALCFFAAKIVSDTTIAEDIVQDCFLKLWENRTHSSVNQDIKSYLYATVRNSAIDTIRKQKRTKLFAAAIDQVLPQYDSQFNEHMVIEAELIRDIYTNIHALPARIRQVFILYYQEGKSYHEISELLATSPETIRKQKSRAIAILKELLFYFIIIFA